LFISSVWLEVAHRAEWNRSFSSQALSYMLFFRSKFQLITMVSDHLAYAHNWSGKFSPFS